MDQKLKRRLDKRCRFGIYYVMIVAAEGMSDTLWWKVWIRVRKKGVPETTLGKATFKNHKQEKSSEGNCA